MWRWGTTCLFGAFWCVPRCSSCLKCQPAWWERVITRGRSFSERVLEFEGTCPAVEGELLHGSVCEAGMEVGGEGSRWVGVSGGAGDESCRWRSLWSPTHWSTSTRIVLSYLFELFAQEAIRRARFVSTSTAFFDGFLMPMEYKSDHSVPSNFSARTCSFARTLTRYPKVRCLLCVCRKK